jgi:hypothetical protein
MHPEKCFSKSTIQMNWCDLESNIENYLGMCDFVYIRHALEKCDHPRAVLQALTQVAPRGYIEFTSALVETLRGVHHSKALYRGHVLNKFIIWVSKEDRVLHILPKFSILEYVKMPVEFEEKIQGILNQYPHYWNSYYMWDENNPIHYIYYQHGVNFHIEHDYTRLLEIAIDQSVQSTNDYLRGVMSSLTKAPEA